MPKFSALRPSLGDKKTDWHAILSHTSLLKRARHFQSPCVCVCVCVWERERERGTEGEIERERWGGGMGGRKRRRRRRNKYNVLIDQSKAQSFLDNHMGLVQDGNNV